jgi:hypothetical protein
MGHKSVSENFPTKAQARAWARKVEAEMDARRFKDVRGLANITLKQPIDWYSVLSAGLKLSAFDSRLMTWSVILLSNSLEQFQIVHAYGWV